MRQMIMMLSGRVRLQWLKDKHIGLPKASGTMTVSQLQKQNYVGVYKI